MKHTRKTRLKTIPFVTLLVAFGLVACDQPQQPTSDAMRAPETQNVDPEVRDAAPGTQGEDRTMEQLRSNDGLRTPMEPTEHGQGEVDTPAIPHRVVFRVKEPNDTTSGWTRLIPRSADSEEPEADLANRNANESIAGMEYHGTFERAN